MELHDYRRLMRDATFESAQAVARLLRRLLPNPRRYRGCAPNSCSVRMKEMTSSRLSMPTT